MEECYRLAERDWPGAATSFLGTSPYNYAVLDDFLPQWEEIVGELGAEVC